MKKSIAASLTFTRQMPSTSQWQCFFRNSLQRSRVNTPRRRLPCHQQISFLKMAKFTPVIVLSGQHHTDRSNLLILFCLIINCKQVRLIHIHIQYKQTLVVCCKEHVKLVNASISAHSEYMVNLKGCTQ